MKLDYSQPQFLKHPIDDCMLRTTYNEKTQMLRVFVRYSGEEEYQVSSETNLFTNTIIQEDPISEKEYWAF